MSTKDDIVLEIKNLDITFKMATGDIHAIRGVNYKVRRNEVLALSGDPDILICDEPTTALDVTIQAKILSLIQNEQRTRGVSVIFITHNFGVVAKMADYIGVMYAGKIIETGTIVDIFYNPKHPYTWGLLSSVSEASDSDERLPKVKLPEIIEARINRMKKQEVDYVRSE